MMLSDIDALVPDRQVRQEFGDISDMTLWRWDRSAEKAALGWPPPVRIGAGKSSRKFRSRKMLEQFKINLLQRALHSGATAA
jgi:hypothetical protein